jgi:uncharacterized protein DUF3618
VFSASVFVANRFDEAPMPTSEQLARRARATREELNRTIDELRTRLAPRNLMDEATAFLTQANEEPMIAEAPRQRSRYALPLALVGAGLAWLAIEARRKEREQEQLPAVPEHGGALATVDETVSIAPAPPVDERQRSFPL